MHTFRYQAHAHGGTRLLAARAEQDEQVVDGKMSVEMRRLLPPTCLLVFLSSCPTCFANKDLHCTTRSRAAVARFQSDQ